MNQDEFRKLISGQKFGVLAGIARFILAISAFFYGCAIRVRNFLYSKKLLKIHKANAAIISVGNITVGGTGKTPLVVWLCKFFGRKNIPCAILTRGYKSGLIPNANRNDYSDEPEIFIKDCPEAQLIVNPDRVAGATDGINKFGAKVLIMDDGFQHRRLGRDLDIVTIDATMPFGFGKLLPAGLLREPISSLKRANAAVITHCDQVDETQLANIEKELLKANPDILIAKTVHSPVCMKSMKGQEISFEDLRNKNVFVFCGIGNPKAFLKSIEDIGLKIIGSRIYNDHHLYSNDDIEQIYREAKKAKADLILTTEKDWTKAEILLIASEAMTSESSDERQLLFAYLAITLKFIGGEEKITRLIEGVAAGKISEKGV